MTWLETWALLSVTIQYGLPIAVVFLLIMAGIFDRITRPK